MNCAISFSGCVLERNNVVYVVFPDERSLLVLWFRISVSMFAMSFLYTWQCHESADSLFLCLLSLLSSFLGEFARSSLLFLFACLALTSRPSPRLFEVPNFCRTRYAWLKTLYILKLSPCYLSLPSNPVAA